jgi:hypothetical protein
MEPFINSHAIMTDFLTASKVGDIIGTLDSGISDSDTSIILNSGFTPLRKGPQVIQIENELIIVYGTTSTLTVIPNGRGLFGTTPAAHVADTNVKRVTFSEVTTNIQAGRLAEFTNSTPGILFRIDGVWDGVVVDYMSKPRVQLKIYGGKDNENQMREELVIAIYGLLLERCSELDDGQESLSSGTIITADGYGEEGQLLYDPDTKPPWPYILTYLNCEVKGA